MNRVLITWLMLFTALPAAASILIPGADGSDGVFNPSASVEVDLGLAITASWDTPGTGNGVYDGEKWAVVFKYSSVNIPAGVTVTFKNHPSYAPVAWLVSGDVDIDGVVDLTGGDPEALHRRAAPGPGGFRGGTNTPRSCRPWARKADRTEERAQAISVVEYYH